MIKSAYLEDDSDDMMMIDLNRSILDPLTQTIMRKPIRGIWCQHSECFDLISFVEINHSAQTDVYQGLSLQYRSWKCPVCRHKISNISFSPFFDLICYFLSQISLSSQNQYFSHKLEPENPITTFKIMQSGIEIAGDLIELSEDKDYYRLRNTKSGKVAKILKLKFSQNNFYEK